MSYVRRKPVPSFDGSDLGALSHIRRTQNQRYTQAPQDEDDITEDISRVGGVDVDWSRDGIMPATSPYELIPSADEMMFADEYHNKQEAKRDVHINDHPVYREQSISDLSTHHQQPQHQTTVEYTGYEPGPNWTVETKRRMYTPIWLTKTVLVCFAVLFFCLMLATALLYFFSKLNKGLSVQEQVNHYGWKYGPTALLVIVGAFWRQVDHANKVLMPWKELQAGAVSVEKSLMLDYISPLLPNSLWMALKNRHWAVAMSIFGHILILLTTVFSTGLLVLESTSVTKERDDFSILSEFKLNDSFIEDPDRLQLASPAAAQLYYGINFQGLGFPAGTSADTIIPELHVPTVSRGNLSYVTTTEGIKLNFDCEMVDIKNGTQVSMPWLSVLGSFWVANITTPGCEIKGATIATGPDHDYFHDKNATQNYQANFDVYPCNMDWDFSHYIAPNETRIMNQRYSTTSDQRVLLAVTDLRFSSYWNNIMLNASDNYMYVNNVTAALCKPSYVMNEFDVRSNNIFDGSPQQVNLDVAAPKPDHQLKGLPAGAISLATRQSTERWYLGTGDDDYKLSYQVPTFYQLMKMTSDVKSVGAFMDPDLLVQSSSKVFKGVATQIVRQLTLQPSQANTTGEITFEEDRLHVTKLSTALMCTFLALMVIISITMIFVRPHSAVPHKPGSMASLATVVAASPALQETLTHMEASRSSTIRERLRSFKFQSVLTLGPQPAFVIEPVRQKEGQTFYQPPEQAGTVVRWWRSIPGTAWFLTLAVLLPVILIVLLEVIQHLSDTQSGFVGVGPKSSLVLATYVPAAVALGVASMYSGLELMAAIFAPFQALKEGRATVERSIGLDLVGKLLPHAAFLSIKTRHYAVIVALLANFIGGFLTIIVSGLYTAVTVPVLDNHSLRQTDAFHLNNVDISVTDNQAAAIDSLVTYLGLNYTRWTHEDLAWNHFEQNDIVFKNKSDTAPLTAAVPAVRAKLNCTTIPASERKITYIDDTQGNAMMGMPGTTAIWSPMPGFIIAGFNYTFDLPEVCERSPSENGTINEWMQYFYVPMDGTEIYVGKSSVMVFGEDSVMADGIVDSSVTSGSGIGANGLFSGDFGCPTFAVTLGSLRVSDVEEVSENVTRWSFDADLGTAVCYQNLEQVMTNVTWTLPEFDLEDSHPPIVDEESRALLKTDQGSERFEYMVNAWLQGINDAVFNRTIGGPGDTPGALNHVDLSINSYVFSRFGRPVDELVGDKNSQNLADTANDLYRVYMAQALSLNMRNSTSEDGSMLPTYTASIEINGHQRLVQNEGPKIALQAMLGVMAVSALVMRILLRLREVLPHNPLTIAGLATLLTGGLLVSRQVVPPGAEWMSDKALKAAGVFERNVYGLKWWQTGDEKTVEGRTRYGVDIDFGGS